MKSDVELMQAFQLGDRDAFEKLVMRHQVGLFNFFVRLMNDRQAAEDQTQEVFFRLYMHAASYVESAKFTTYLYRIAKNCWIDHLRRVSRRRVPQSLDRENDEGLNLYDRLPAHISSPESHLAETDKRAAIDAAIELLPEEQRVVFVLSEIQGMKYLEISETLGIPLGTVKSRMHVAMQRLRESLSRTGIIDKGI